MGIIKRFPNVLFCSVRIIPVERRGLELGLVLHALGKSNISTLRRGTRKKMELLPIVKECLEPNFFLFGKRKMVELYQ